MYGSIASPYRLIKNYSLNDLRLNSKNLSNITNGVYHFTSIGNKQTIIKKIESWAHQEFNNNIVKNNIEENLINGKDIFYRFKENKNKCININYSDMSLSVSARWVVYKQESESLKGQIYDNPLRQIYHRIQNKK